VLQLSDPYAPISRIRNAPPESAGSAGGDRAKSPNRKGTIHAVVLAGTHPWGRCPLDDVIPRPLLPVANRPLIRYALDWLDDARVSSITICGNSDTPTIRGVVGESDAASPNIDYYVDPLPRGPAGCIRDAVADRNVQDILVIDGTIVPQIRLGDLLAEHERSRCAMTLVVVRDGPSPQASHSLIPTGIYVLTSDVLDYIPLGGYQDIKESLIPRLFDAGLRIQTMIVEAQAPRVSDADSYLSVNDWAVGLKARLLSGSFGYQSAGESCVHESSTVDSSARCIGPVLIGPQARIGRNALLVGPTSVGVGCYVGDDAVICRSAVWNQVQIEAHSIVNRSIVTHGRTVPSGLSLRRTVVASEESGRARPRDTAAHWPAKTADPQRAAS